MDTFFSNLRKFAQNVTLVHVSTHTQVCLDERIRWKALEGSFKVKKTEKTCFYALKFTTFEGSDLQKLQKAAAV